MGVEQGLTIDNTLFFSIRNQTIAVRIGKLKHGKEKNVLKSL